MYPLILQRLGVLLLSGAVDLGEHWRHSLFCILHSLKQFSYTAPPSESYTASPPERGATLQHELLICQEVTFMATEACSETLNFWSTSSHCTRLACDVWSLLQQTLQSTAQLMLVWVIPAVAHSPQCAFLSAVPDLLFGALSWRPAYIILQLPCSTYAQNLQQMHGDTGVLQAARSTMTRLPVVNDLVCSSSTKQLLREAISKVLMNLAPT